MCASRLALPILAVPRTARRGLDGDLTSIAFIDRRPTLYVPQTLWHVSQNARVLIAA